MNKKNYQLFSLEDTINYGTLFKDIYYPYKKSPKLIAENSEEEKLKVIQEYAIALMDLNLYLDIYPNDNYLLNLFNEYQNQYEKHVKEFESKYYPLNASSASKNNYWNWLEGKWPWERDYRV